MARLFAALSRALTSSQQYREPSVHFHSSSAEDHPEVCYEQECRRPRLRVP